MLLYLVEVVQSNGEPVVNDRVIIHSGRLTKQALADFYWQRGSHFATLRQHVSAIADFTETLTYVPDSIKAYVSRAVSFARIEQYQEAFTDLSLAEKLNANRVFNDFPEGETSAAICGVAPS